MKANIHCECQSRMHAENGIAVCRNGACKHFGVEFKAPKLELQKVGADRQAPAAPAPEVTEITAHTAEPVGLAAEHEAHKG